MTLEYWGRSLTVGFCRLRGVYLLKEIERRLIRIFTPKNCFYFSFTMSVNLAIVYKFSRLFINSCKHFVISFDVYLIMEVVASESLQRLTC